MVSTSKLQAYLALVFQATKEAKQKGWGPESDDLSEQAPRVETTSLGTGLNGT
jgi:hypothetical protein